MFFDDMRFLISLVLFGALAVVIIVGAVGIATIPWNLKECSALDGTDVVHEWWFWGGCKVQRPNGIWVDADNYYMLEHLDFVE